MNDLEGPYTLTGGGPQRDDAIRVQVRPFSFPSIVIGTGTGRRDVHDVPGRIHRKDRPGIGAASLMRLRPLPARISAVLGIGGDRVPTPDQPAAAGVKSPDDSVWVIKSLVVAHR